MAAERPARRRPWLSVLGVLVVIGLLAGAAELALRLIIPSIIANAVRDSFDMTDDHPVEVELGGSALLYALSGRVGDVSLRVDEVPVMGGAGAGGLFVDVRAHAESAPFNVTTGEIEGAVASVTVSRDQLGQVVSLVTGGIADTAAVENGEISVGRSIEIFGISVPLEVTLRVSIADGDVFVEPTAVGAVGLDLTAEQISGYTGSLLDGVLTAHAVCVRDRLPAGITLTSLDFSSTGAATVSAAIAPGILSDPAQLEHGSCG